MSTAFGHKWVFIVLIFTGLDLNLSSHAAITIQSITGASNWEEEADNLIIYGGFAGENDSCTDNSDGTCNNCSVYLNACNEKRIKLESSLRITLKSDSVEIPGPIIITSSDGNSQIGDDGDIVEKNTSGSVEVTWSTLCNNAFTGITESSSCVSTSHPSSVATLMIGVDQDGNGQLSSSEGETFSLKVHKPINADTIDHCEDTNATFTDGICAFTVFPGDQKIFIESLEPTSTFPNSGNIQFSHALFFYSTVGFTGGIDGANPGSKFGYISVKIETENDEYFLAKDYLDQLSNDAFYFFRIAMLDQANNISFITSDSAILFACGESASDLEANLNNSLNCPFIVKPDEVVSLLSKDISCFIATAAYGSSLDNHLKTFRSFRRKFLLTREWGKHFMYNYYKYGPYAAQWIEKHPWSKPIVRTILWPLWAWAYLTLKLGWIFTTLIFVFFPSLIIFLIRKLLLWRHQYEMAP